VTRTTVRTPRARRGFTILELLIVIGILLAIGGLVLYNVLGASEKADLRLTRVQIQSFDKALADFKSEMKRWPTSEEGLKVLWSKEALQDEEEISKWGGPYMTEASPKDTWGHEWIYRQPSDIDETKPYDIISIGPDGQEGTEDDIANNKEAVDSEDGDGGSGGGAG
jgi:general secretion pathway protein G